MIKKDFEGLMRPAGDERIVLGKNITYTLDLFPDRRPMVIRGGSLDGTGNETIHPSLNIAPCSRREELMRTAHVMANLFEEARGNRQCVSVTIEKMTGDGFKVSVENPF